MLSTLILYLTQKFETFTYLQKVYGLGLEREVNDSKFISVIEGNTEQHLNLDTHLSCSVFLKNGNKSVEQVESPTVANEYLVKHTYPFKCLVYAKIAESANCESESQKIADSIEKSITGRQKAILASTQLDNAYIEIKNTNYEKHSIYSGYYTGGGLGDNDILIEIEFDFIVEGNQNCFVDSPCDNDDFVFDFDAPQTFCERVDACLDIPTADGQYVLEITDGVKSWAEYSPTGQVVISKTESQFNALVAAGTLQYPAVYKITDIQQGLYVNTLSGSTFNPEAQLSFLAPDYTLHQQYHSTDGAIANNAIVTWGGFYWQNTSGGAVTPDLPDEATIDSNPALFTQIAKSEANGYVAIQLSVTVKNDLTITQATNQDLTKAYIITGLNTLDQQQFNIQGSNGINELFNISNNVTDSDAILSVNKGFCNIYRNVVTNGGAITNCGHNCVIHDNILSAPGGFHVIYGSLIVTNVTMTSSGNGWCVIDSVSSENNLSYIDVVTATASNDGKCIISACKLNNNVQWTNFILTNTGTGADKTSAIFDVHCHENVVIDGLEIVSNEVANLQGCVFWMGDQVNNLWLKGDFVFFKANESRECIWDNCKLEHDNSAIQYIHADRSTINYSVTSGASQGYAMEFGEIVDSEIINAADFNIKNFSFKNIDIDFTGWGRDINDEYIEGGKGWFTITHDFSASPLTSGSSVYYNFIPTGSRLTNCTIIPNSLTGTTIEIGLETDAEGLINEAVGLLPLTWSGVSAAATANRSLKIKATGGNITAGTLNVKVEFTI